MPDKLSFIGSARFSRIDLLQKLYGTVRDYVALPHSADGAAKLLYRYSSTGRLSALYLGAGDGVDVIARRYNYAGLVPGQRADQPRRDPVAGHLGRAPRAARPRRVSELSQRQPLRRDGPDAA